MRVGKECRDESVVVVERKGMARLLAGKTE
jgi:hypothetical protein